MHSSAAAGIAGSSNLSAVVDHTTAFTSACSYADASSGASVSVSITRVPGGQAAASSQSKAEDLARTIAGKA